MWLTTFTVEAPRKERFPLDMLRYDACYPATSIDVEQINSSLYHAHTGLVADEKQGPIRVALTRTGSTKRAAAPTPARWASFGWQVIESYSRRA